MTAMAPVRTFVVDTGGAAVALSVEETVTHMGVSPAASAAYDILTDDGYPAEKAWEMVLAAEKGGQQPEAFARHFVKLRKAVRGMSA